MFFEFRPTAIQFPIMVQVVHDYFKAPLHEFAPQPIRSVVAPRHESESRAEAPGLLKVRKVIRMDQTGLLLHVVGEYDGEPLAVRPARPAWRRVAGLLPDWPVTAISVLVSR